VCIDLTRSAIAAVDGAAPPDDVPVPRGRAGRVRVGTYQTPRVMSESSVGKGAKARLKTLFTQKQRELDADQAVVKRLKEDLDKQRPVLNAEAVARKERDLQERFTALQGKYVRSQKALTEMEQRETAVIVARLKRALPEVGQRLGVAASLEAECVPSAETVCVDLTGPLVAAVDAGGSTERGAPPPRAAPPPPTQPAPAPHTPAPAPAPAPAPKPKPKK
jgi:Skp family chaperone for outer membrane proteins